MKFLTTILALFVFAGYAFAQLDYPLASVRSDFNDASVVVRIEITDTKLTGDDDGYAYGFIASGFVTQAFKGKFRSGQYLEFYVRADRGYDHTKMRGDRIAFLTSFVNRRDGPFQELPDGNSVFPYSQDVLNKVQKVSRETRKYRKGHK